MAEAVLTASPLRNRAPVLGLLIILLAFCLLAVNLLALLPARLWLTALLATNTSDLRHLMARDVLLPRFVVALACGAGLGLAGLLFQQVLRNSLAEPGTLGVFAGAKCALVIATLWAPGLLSLGWDVIAFAGGASVMLVVLLIAARHAFSPLSVILAGLVVSLCLGALGSMLMMTHFEAVMDLYLWEAGSLVQNNWDVAAALLPRLGIALLLTLVMARRLDLLDLGEESARSLGMPLAATRLIGMSIAVALSAVIAGLVGLISFIGLAGPAIARHTGARRFRDRLIAGPLIAGGILALADQGLVFLARGIEIPAGAVSALVGAPLLLWLMREIRPASQGARAEVGIGNAFAACTATQWKTVLTIVLFAAIVTVALSLGRNPQGWHFAMGEEFGELLPWRLPRVAAAAAAGLMLALAGLLIQRMTGNALASPELLGISSGVGLFLILAMFFLPVQDRSSMFVLASLGALLVLAAVLWLGQRSSFAPEHLLLAGVALGSVMSSLLTYMTTLGDPRLLRVLAWLSGSTYGVTAAEALVAWLFALLGLAVLPLVARWLAILPLGQATSRGLGVPEGPSRLYLLLVTAVLTGCATLLAGPLSFVGLMAPHLARLAGFRRPLAQAYAAAALGAGLMMMADWIGRTIAFPWQVPAGFVSTVIGGAFCAALLSRR